MIGTPYRPILSFTSFIMERSTFMRLSTILSILTLTALISISADAQLAREWVARYSGLKGGVDIATAITVGDTGNVYVTGYSARSSNINNIVTIKYSPDGVRLWVA